MSYADLAAQELRERRIAKRGIGIGKDRQRRLRQARLGSHDRLFASHGRECRIHAAIQRHVTFGTTKFLSGGAIDAYAQRKRQQSGTKENGEHRLT